MTPSGSGSASGSADLLFLDANVIIYAAGDREREPSAACAALVDAATDGAIEVRTSTAVIEEVWHLELSGRIDSASGVAAQALLMLAPLLPVTQETLRGAFEIDAPPELGANDRLHCAACLEHGIEVIVTGDDAFEGVAGLRRVDPYDGAAMSQLLEGRPA